MKPFFLQLLALNLLCLYSFSATWYEAPTPQLKHIHHKTVNSTQDSMEDAVNAFAMEESAQLNDLIGQRSLYTNQILYISADEQTDGKGNESRSWQSPQGGIYATFLFPWPLFKWPDWREHETVSRFFQEIAAISVIEVLEKYRMAPQLKWPTDVLVKGKKICGILFKGLDEVPFSSSSQPHDAWIVGIGLNVNMDVEIKERMEQKPASQQDDMGLPFTSMQLELDRLFTDKDVQEIMGHLTQHLIKNYQKLINEKDSVIKVFLPFIDNHLAYVGERVEYKTDKDAQPEKDLTVVGVDIWGKLRLKDKEGRPLTKGGGRIFPQSLRS